MAAHRGTNRVRLPPQSPYNPENLFRNNQNVEPNPEPAG